jgi:hypothetical protein
VKVVFLPSRLPEELVAKSARRRLQERLPAGASSHKSLRLRLSAGATRDARDGES